MNKHRAKYIMDSYRRMRSIISVEEEVEKCLEDILNKADTKFDVYERNPTGKRVDYSGCEEVIKNFVEKFGGPEGETVEEYYDRYVEYCVSLDKGAVSKSLLGRKLSKMGYKNLVKYSLKYKKNLRTWG